MEILDFSTDFIKDFFAGFGVVIKDSTATTLFSLIVSLALLSFLGKWIYMMAGKLWKKRNSVKKWRDNYVTI